MTTIAETLALPSAALAASVPPESVPRRAPESSPAAVPSGQTAKSPLPASSRILRKLEPFVLWLILLALWFAVAHWLPLGENPLIPSPQATALALWQSLPELWKGTLASLGILVPGFALAVTLGVASGLVVGISPRLQRIFFPFARVAGPVPPTVYVPYAIAILPTFQLSAIFVVWIGAFWPIFQNTAAGAAALDARYRDNASILRMRGLEYAFRVVLPASLSHVFSGMGVGLAFAFILLTVAETFGASAGLGRFVQYYADFADYPRMVAGILYTGFVTWFAMTLLDKLKHRMLFWQR
ncbi:MAG: ABC transporter permease subunit [Zoogloeaceae bacterium]|jgi:NitT/TauT family transport system permease protein|nr:ABC transporter permease subunit [Zoogloeaceae bacterium]